MDIDYCIPVLESKFIEVDGESFYREIFPANENTGEMNMHYQKPNAIYFYMDEERKRLRRRIMLNDTWSDDYMNYIECNPMTLCGGLSYRGRSNKLENAQNMHALVIDLDSVGIDEMIALIKCWELEVSELLAMPKPTFVVASGTGLHLWFVFEDPIPLYPNIKLQMKSLKHDITAKCWRYKITTKEESVQYQSINQGFRMVGSLNNKYGTVVRAFRTGERVTLQYLNQYVNEISRVDPKVKYGGTAMSLEEARERFPEWYERRVVNKIKSTKKWDISGKVHGKDPYALYHWWLNQWIDATVGGHRYWYMFILAVYAAKCEVPRDMLKKDMQDIFVRLKAVEHISPITGEDDPLTEFDMNQAMDGYRRDLYQVRLSTIEYWMDIKGQIPRNKRNGRTQSKHLEGARAIRDINNPNWRQGNGRKPKKDVVQQWRADHPDGRKCDCIRDTGLDKKTVYKWW